MVAFEHVTNRLKTRIFIGRKMYDEWAPTILAATISISSLWHFKVVQMQCDILFIKTV